MNSLYTSAALAGILALGSVTSAHAFESEETREVPAFDEVELDGSFDVEVRVGGERSVKIIVDDEEDLERIEVEVRNGRLHIWSKRENRISFNFGRNHRRLVEVTVPSLKGAYLDGSGDLIVTGIDADEFTGELDGSGDLALSGTCTNLDADLDGSGDIRARNLECSNVDVRLDGSGDITVFASESVTARLRGSGDIDVRGKPKQRDTSTSGSGDIDVD